MGKPRPASSTEGERTWERVMLPKRDSAEIQVETASGTTAASSPSPGMASIPSFPNPSMVAFCGAGPWPERLTTRFSSDR